MQVTSHDVPVPGTLVAVTAVVAHALRGGAQRPHAAAQGCLAAVVLVAKHLPELRRGNFDVADQPLLGAVRLNIQDADARDHSACAGLEEVSEELVQPADDKHGRTVLRQVLQHTGAGLKVVLDDQLAAVLAAAAHNNVHVLRERIPHVVLKQFRGVTVPAHALLQDQGVAPVTVDVHVARVKLHHPEGALAPGVFLCGTSTCLAQETTSTVVILDSSRRMASIAV